MTWSTSVHTYTHTHTHTHTPTHTPTHTHTHKPPDKTRRQTIQRGNTPAYVSFSVSVQVNMAICKQLPCPRRGTPAPRCGFEKICRRTAKRSLMRICGQSLATLRGSSLPDSGQRLGQRQRLLLICCRSSSAGREIWTPRLHVRGHLPSQPVTNVHT